MTTVVVRGVPEAVLAELQDKAAVQLDWRTAQRNAIVGLDALQEAVGLLPARAQDLVEIAAAAYLADLAVPRGRNEAYVRSFEIHVPVAEPDFWHEQASNLSRLMYLLTADNVSFAFHPRSGDTARVAAVGFAAGSDALCMLSGGLDSLAGAVMLLNAGRRPLFVTHRSGNPTVARAQAAVLKTLRRLSSELGHVYVPVMPRVTDVSLPFPPPEQREPSRRSRSLLFMALGAAAASALGTQEVYLCENGVLTAAVPLAPSRVGGLSTRSTHPAVLGLFTSLCRTAGLACQVINPFLYRTKAELIRDILRPLLRVEEIQSTVSCWMAGRRHRQCGGCVPCLIRRISMLAAGLPDEAYEMDLLGRPQDYQGTDAYVNLVDLLSYAVYLMDRSPLEIIMSAPRLLDMQAYNVSVPDIVDMLKRFAEEVRQVVSTYFPRAEALMASISDRGID